MGMRYTVLMRRIRKKLYLVMLIIVGSIVLLVTPMYQERFGKEAEKPLILMMLAFDFVCVSYMSGSVKKQTEKLYLLYKTFGLKERQIFYMLGKRALLALPFFLVGVYLFQPTGTGNFIHILLFHCSSWGLCVLAAYLLSFYPRGKRILSRILSLVTIAFLWYVVTIIIQVRKMGYEKRELVWQVLRSIDTEKIELLVFRPPLWMTFLLMVGIALLLLGLGIVEKHQMSAMLEKVRQDVCGSTLGQCAEKRKFLPNKLFRKRHFDLYLTYMLYFLCAFFIRNETILFFWGNASFSIFLIIGATEYLYRDDVGCKLLYYMFGVEYKSMLLEKGKKGACFLMPQLAVQMVSLLLNPGLITEFLKVLLVAVIFLIYWNCYYGRLFLGMQRWSSPLELIFTLGTLIVFLLPGVNLLFAYLWYRQGCRRWGIPRRNSED